MDIKSFPKQVIRENVDYTVKEITNVIKKYGPRESGNENCYAAQKHMKKELDTFCDETHFEEYKMAPKAFLMFTKVLSALVFIGVAVGLVTGITCGYSSRCRYWVDPIIKFLGPIPTSTWIPIMMVVASSLFQGHL